MFYIDVFLPKTLFIFLTQFIRVLTLNACRQVCTIMAEYECYVMVRAGRTKTFLQVSIHWLNSKFHGNDIYFIHHCFEIFPNYSGHLNT